MSRRFGSGRLPREPQPRARIVGPYAMSNIAIPRSSTEHVFDRRSTFVRSSQNVHSTGPHVVCPVFGSTSQRRMRLSSMML